MTYEIHYATDEHAKQWKKLPPLRNYAEVRKFIDAQKTSHGSAFRYRVVTKDCEPMT